VLDEERFEDTFLKCLICRENYDDGEKVILGQLMCPEMNRKMKDSPLVMEKSWFNVSGEITRLLGNPVARLLVNVFVLILRKRNSCI